MTAIKNIFLCLWLIFFGIAHASVTAHHSSESRVWKISDIGYDAVYELNVDYDGSYM